MNTMSSLQISAAFVLLVGALAATPAHAQEAPGSVLLELRFAPPESSWRDQGRACEKLKFQLDDAVAAARVADSRGYQAGSGECTISYSGDNVGALWKVVGPIVKKARVSRGGTARLAYGMERVEHKL